MYFYEILSTYSLKKILYFFRNFGVFQKAVSWNSRWRKDVRLEVINKL